MIKQYRMALAAALLGATAQAHGQLYVCSDAQGHKTYTDKRENAACKLLDLPGAMTEPPRRTAPLALPTRSIRAKPPRKICTICRQKKTH